MAFENRPHEPEGLTASEPFVNAHGRSLVVIVLFVAYIVVTLAATAVNLMRLTLPDMVLSADADAHLTLTELLEFLVALPALLVNLALIVMFLVWLYRVSKNIPALGNPKARVEYTPGWAVGSFFIPFGNLYMPYKGVREVWEKSDPGIRTANDYMLAPPSTAPLLLGWWVMWITHNVLSNIYIRLQWRSGVREGEPALIVLDIVSDVAGIVAAALAIFVVRGIDKRQQERSRNVAYVSHTPPPPLFTPPPPPPPPWPQS